MKDKKNHQRGLKAGNAAIVTALFYNELRIGVLIFRHSRDSLYDLPVLFSAVKRK